MLLQRVTDLRCRGNTSLRLKIIGLGCRFGLWSLEILHDNAVRAVSTAAYVLPITRKGLES